MTTTEYIVNGHKFRVEKGIPLPGEAVKAKEVSMLPVDKMHPGDSLLSDIEYNPKNVDAVKSRIKYIRKRYPEMMKGKKVSPRKDPVSNILIRIYCLPSDLN